ncbi:MAG: glycine betaine ABC transporter substrate-binding protein [Chloroflexia bacterium]
MFHRMNSLAAGLMGLAMVLPLLAACDTSTPTVPAPGTTPTAMTGTAPTAMTTAMTGTEPTAMAPDMTATAMTVMGPTAVATGMTAMTPTAGAATGTKPTITVASKDFAEERLIGEMYAQLLEQAGYKVNRKLGLGEVTVIQPALVNGDVQMYPEYTGTGLTVVLKKDPMSDAQQVFTTVSQAYESQYKLTWLDPAPMNDTQALATTKAISDQYGIKTLSDVATKAPQLRLTCAPAFIDRPDGIPGLQKAYGGFQFKDVKSVDISLRYKALLAGQTDITEAFSTDGTIAGNNLVVMEDDKHFFPPYQVAPVVRDDLLAAAPDIKSILNPLAPKLTNSSVSAMNWEVEGKKREVADVAKEFLKNNGLLK